MSKKKDTTQEFNILFEKILRKLEAPDYYSEVPFVVAKNEDGWEESFNIKQSFQNILFEIINKKTGKHEFAKLYLAPHICEEEYRYFYLKYLNKDAISCSVLKLTQEDLDACSSQEILKRILSNTEDGVLLKSRGISEDKKIVSVDIISSKSKKTVYRMERV